MPLGVCPLIIDAGRFCLRMRIPQANEIWGDQLVKPPDPCWGNGDEWIKKQWVKDPEWHTWTFTDIKLGGGLLGGAGGKGQFQPIQRKMDLVEKTLRVFLNLVIVRSYTSSGPGKNKLLHKVKKARWENEGKRSFRTRHLLGDVLRKERVWPIPRDWSGQEKILRNVHKRLTVK